MEEENRRNQHQSNFDKFQKTVSSVVEIIRKNVWKIERMFPNNFQKVWEIWKKMSKNLNCDEIFILLRVNCNKILQEMLDNVKTFFLKHSKKRLNKGFYRLRKIL